MGLCRRDSKKTLYETGHQSTKTTQWTVDRLADQINSDQSNQSPSQEVSNQPTCKKVSQDSYLITQLVIS